MIGTCPHHETTVQFKTLDDWAHHSGCRPPSEEIRHGTSHGFFGHQCRCDRCKAWRSKVRRESHERQRAGWRKK